MKKYFYLSVLIIFASCNLQDLTKIDTDLKNLLNTENVNTTISVGTESKDNFIRIDLVEYNFENKSHQYLDSLSKVINERIHQKFPEVAKSKIIEIRFTAEKDADSANSIVLFKY